jgi:cytoskeletal protein CcmA (bactofilin family)
MSKKKSSAIRFLDPTVESFETIVGPRTVFRGNIAAYESIRIDGKVIGNIESPPGSNITVALGKTAILQGDINTYRALIAGRVDGNIYASERAELHNGADIHGEVIYGQIGVEQGAKLTGTMSRIDPDEPQEISPEAMEIFLEFVREDEEGDKNGSK